MRRSMNTRPRPPHITRERVRYNLTIALLALIAVLILAALVAPNAVNLPVVLPVLIPPLMLALRYYFDPRR